MVASIWGGRLHHRANRRRRMRARWVEHAPCQYIPPLLVGRITYALSLHRLSLVVYGCLGGGSCVGSGCGRRLGDWRIHGRLSTLDAMLYRAAMFLWLRAACRGAPGHEPTVDGGGEKSEEDPHACPYTRLHNTALYAIARSILHDSPVYDPTRLCVCTTQPIYSLAEPGHCCSILIESHFLLPSGVGGSISARPPSTSTLLNATIQLMASSIQPPRIAFNWPVPSDRNPPAARLAPTCTSSACVAFCSFHCEIRPYITD